VSNDFADERAELRALATVILEINADTRRMAEELTSTILGVVDAQCSAAEGRAQAVLNALDAHESS
jgi:hypothetical protein